MVYFQELVLGNVVAGTQLMLNQLILSSTMTPFLEFFLLLQYALIQIFETQIQ